MKLAGSVSEKPPISMNVSRRIAAQAAVTPLASRLMMSAPNGPYDVARQVAEGVEVVPPGVGVAGVLDGVVAEVEPGTRQPDVGLVEGADQLARASPSEITSTSSLRKTSRSPEARRQPTFIFSL